jgi:hypothetical protein
MRPLPRIARPVKQTLAPPGVSRDQPNSKRNICPSVDKKPSSARPKNFVPFVPLCEKKGQSHPPKKICVHLRNLRLKKPTTPRPGEHTASAGFGGDLNLCADPLFQGGDVRDDADQLAVML